MTPDSPPTALCHLGSKAEPIGAPTISSQISCSTCASAIYSLYLGRNRKDSYFKKRILWYKVEVNRLSYYYMPRPAQKAAYLPPAQQYLVPRPPDVYAYQPPPQEYLIVQPPEVFYQPPPQEYLVPQLPQRVLYQPPPMEYFYQPPPQPAVYMPPPQEYYYQLPPTRYLTQQLPYRVC